MKKIKGVYDKYSEVILYLFFGGLSFVLNIFIYTMLVHVLGFEELLANLISWLIVVIFVYITNKKWVFKYNNNKNMQLFIEFAMARVVTLLIEEVILFVGIKVFGINDIVIKIVGQVVTIVSNYIFSKLVVFKK